jgi:hypothetical protein
MARVRRGRTRSSVRLDGTVFTVSLVAIGK